MTGAAIAGVAVAGGLGSLARVMVDSWARRVVPAPWGIAVVNASGALALGLLLGGGRSGGLAIVLGTGFLGAYTTFSTWMLDTVLLAEGHRPRIAWANVVVQVGVGLALAAVGLLAGSAITT